jgi:nucleotide-binding universal stress UspA family protein
MDIEPARAIIRYSEKSNFDNIVLGRRPDSDKGFFKGVSDRVLANAKNSAIWIVG